MWYNISNIGYDMINSCYICSQVQLIYNYTFTSFLITYFDLLLTLV